MTTEQLTTELPAMPLHQIAGIIAKDWGIKTNYAAKPYLSAMFNLSNVKDNYGMDNGRSIVAYFLSNAGTWRGDIAKLVKKELNKRIK